MKRLYIALAVIVIVAVAGGSIYYWTISTAPSKRILRFTDTGPNYIDPAVGSDASSARCLVNLYDALTHPLPEGGVEPWVAESWNVSENGLNWTFRIRQGIKFHDGSELTAEDVVFSLERFVTIGEGYSFLLTPYVDNAKVIDDYTVQINLKKPFGPFLSVLIYTRVLNKDLVMEHIETPGAYGEYGDYGKDWLLTHDAGSGAYKVKEVSLAEYFVFELFEDYWGEVASKAPEEVKLILTTEPATVKTMMTRKELEITSMWQSAETLEDLDKMEGVDIADLYLGQVVEFFIHTRKPPTDDIHFRRAMAYAYDYDEALKIIPGSKQARGPCASSLFGWDPSMFQFERNLTKAMEELQKSRYYNNLSEYTVEFHWVAEVHAEEKLALLFATNMEEIGIQVNVVKTPWLTCVEETSTLETSPNIMPMYMSARYPELVGVLSTRYHSSSATGYEQMEWLLNETIDAMIEDALETVDPEERASKSLGIANTIIDMCPTIWIAEAPRRVAYQAGYLDWYAAELTQHSPLGYSHEFRLVEIVD